MCVCQRRFLGLRLCFRVRVNIWFCMKLGIQYCYDIVWNCDTCVFSPLVPACSSLPFHTKTYLGLLFEPITVPHGLSVDAERSVCLCVYCTSQEIVAV